MMKHYLPVAAAALALAVLTGCVDDKYDLSDIDQTVQVAVNDLTIPLNVDAVTLSTLFDLDENDPDAVVKVVDGVYAIEKKGSFKSNGVEVNVIRLNGISGNAQQGTIHTGGVTVPSGQDVTFPISADPIEFGFKSNDVPAEVLRIDKLFGSYELYITVELRGASHAVNGFAVRDLNIALPKGLSATSEQGSYDPSTGILTVREVKATGDKAQIVLKGTAIDYKAAGGQFDSATHTASYDGSMTLSSGSISINGNDVQGALPSEITFAASLGVSSLVVDKFSGEVTYTLENVNVNPVTLNDLPDILSKEGTRISIINPQIYLNIDNPVADYGLTAETGFRITSTFPADRHSEPVVAELDAPGYFTIEAKPNANYLLSPKNVSKPAEGFANPTHVPYSALSGILLGNGLPSSLDIELLHPVITPKTVEEFPLGTSLGDVAGNYLFYAPIALGARSQIEYNDVQDGWADEDLDAVTISLLEISMDVTSDLPFSLNLTGYPIDKEGKQINNVKVEGADIPANANGQKVVIRTTGSINKLDGFNYTATGLVPEDMKNPLSPNQNIRLENIRVKVSGHYTKDLGE